LAEKKAQASELKPTTSGATVSKNLAQEDVSKRKTSLNIEEESRATKKQKTVLQQEEPLKRKVAPDIEEFRAAKKQKVEPEKPKKEIQKEEIVSKEISKNEKTPALKDVSKEEKKTRGTIKSKESSVDLSASPKGNNKTPTKAKAKKTVIY